jgi:hypothetical protein
MYHRQEITKIEKYKIKLLYTNSSNYNSYNNYFNYIIIFPKFIFRFQFINYKLWIIVFNFKKLYIYYD